MRLKDATLFVGVNVRRIPSKDKFCAKSWGCVDGRERREEEDDHFAGPGGALGIKYAVIAGLQAYEKEHGPLGIAFDHLTRAIEDRLGGMSCHSDADSIDSGESHISAGCGHCSGALKMSEEYGLERYAHLLEEHINDLKNRGVNPKVLKEKHDEKAVFVIAQAVNGQSLTLPGTGRDGQQAFVCHLEDWLEVVSWLSSVVTECASVKVNEGRLCKYIRAAAKRQLGVTLRRLAAGLPVYRVSRDEVGAISVELMAEDAAVAIV